MTIVHQGNGMPAHGGKPRRRGWATMLLATILAGCGALEPGSVAPGDIPDPTTIPRPGTPNDWLICPAGICTAEASAMPATYGVPPERLFATWQEVLATQPRVIA